MEALMLLPADISSSISSLRGGWIGPIFILVLIGLSIKFLWERQVRAFVGFLVFAVIIALIVFKAENYFGESGVLTNTVDEEAQTAFSAIVLNE